MSLLKKILSSVVEFDEKPPVTLATQQKLNAPSPTFAVRQPVQVAGMSAEDFEKFEKHFMALLEQANLPGPDYFEFLQVAEKLEATIPNEQMRYAATFASLNVSGLSKDTLLNSAQQYVEILQQDKKKFQDAIAAKQQNEIGAKKAQIDALTKRIETLNAEIENCRGEINTLTQQTAEAEQVIRKNEGAYLAACETIIQKISSDIQKVQTSL